MPANAEHRTRRRHAICENGVRETGNQILAFLVAKLQFGGNDDVVGVRFMLCLNYASDFVDGMCQKQNRNVTRGRMSGDGACVGLVCY